MKWTLNCYDATMSQQCPPIGILKKSDVRIMTIMRIVRKTKPEYSQIPARVYIKLYIHTTFCGLCSDSAWILLGRREEAEKVSEIYSTPQIPSFGVCFEDTSIAKSKSDFLTKHNLLRKGA